MWKETLAKESERQQTLHSHLKELPPREKVIRYTEQHFHEVAIEWLIMTDQICISSVYLSVVVS